MGLTRKQYRQLWGNLAAVAARELDTLNVVDDAVTPKASIIRNLSGREAFDRMNRTEAAYSGYLESLRMAGLISWWGFEAVKLRLANRTWYMPDFTVIHYERAPARFEFHEVKGFWRDDARVKFKVAAEQFPWARFIAVKKRGESWETEIA